MPFQTGDIVIENLFYGALPERRKGQEVLGKTSGITPEIEREIVEYCSSWGDCRNLKFRRSLNQFPLTAKSQSGEGLIAVVKVVNSGIDSMGREGNLARHALILTEGCYRHLEYNPFTLESQGVFLGVWTRQCHCQTILLNSHLIPPSDLSEIPKTFFEPLSDYLHAILSGGEIYLFLPNHLHPAEDIIYYLIKLLPISFRPSISLTTFAFRKNLNYQIGCYFRQSSILPDPLRVRFETSKDRKEEIAPYLKALFDELKGEKYSRAAKMLASSF
jgi:hypothetical protein